MALNPNIILAGQQPDIVNALARSTQSAGMAQQVQQEAKKNAFLGRNGAALMAGDQQALSGFAQFDPVGATNMLSTRQGMNIAAQTNARAASKQSAEMLAIVNKMSAAEAAQELAATEAAMRQATTYFLQGNLAGVNSVLSAEGIGELQSLDQYEAIALGFKDATEMLKAKAEMEAARNPKPADDYGRYRQEEIAAGRQPLDRIRYHRELKATPPAPSSEPAAIAALRFRAQEAGLVPGSPEYQTFMANGGSGGKATTVYDPATGRPLVQIGGNPSQDAGKLQPSSPQSMLNTIDGILGDPALDSATGIFSFLQMVPGTEQRRVGARIRQLDGQAFLQAFESLKGGGQITEIEGTKATQAIGRLDSAQRPEDYRAALAELRDLLLIARDRPQGWAEQQAATTPAPSALKVGTVENGYRFKGGDPALPESWEAVQ